MIQLAIDHPEAGRHDLRGVQLLAYGGSVISEALLHRAMRCFPNAASCSSTA